MYEKGVAVFKYPHVRDIWLTYLQHFVKRYGGTKLERARDLFKQALREVPPGLTPLSRPIGVKELHTLPKLCLCFVTPCLQSNAILHYPEMHEMTPDFRRFLVCSVQAPADEAKPLFLQYAGLEEEHGLARSAMEVYDRAVKTVPLKERLTVYELYLARAHEYFGLGKVALFPLLPLQAICCLEFW